MLPVLLPPKKILIADDHEMVLRGLADGFSQNPKFELVASVQRAPEITRAYRETQPDVALLDFRMPGMHADQVTEEILAQDPNAKIIILSSYEMEEDVWRAVVAGASGYLPKTSRLQEIHDAIDQVVGGGRCFPPQISEKIRQRRRREDLTKREMEILSLLADGLGNQKIAAALGISETTVKTHVSRVLAKVDALDRLQAVIIAAQRGVVRLEGPAD